MPREAGQQRVSFNVISWPFQRGKAKLTPCQQIPRVKCRQRSAEFSYQKFQELAVEETSRRNFLASLWFQRSMTGKRRFQMLLLKRSGRFSMIRREQHIHSTIMSNGFVIVMVSIVSTAKRDLERAL
jgi:hypothetical protein